MGFDSPMNVQLIRMAIIKDQYILRAVESTDAIAKSQTRSLKKDTN